MHKANSYWQPLDGAEIGTAFHEILAVILRLVKVVIAILSKITL